MTLLLDSVLVGEGYSRPHPSSSRERILILGVGNLLMGDEGLGVHLVRRLEEGSPLDGVRVLDGGTGGANLLGEFDGLRAVVMIDATRDGAAAGTVAYRYRRSYGSGELPRGLSAHDFGLRDLFAGAALIGSLPELHLFTVAVEEVRPMCTELSDPVAAAVPTVVAAVRACAARLVWRAAASSGFVEVSPAPARLLQPSRAGETARVEKQPALGKK